MAGFTNTMHITSTNGCINVGALVENIDTGLMSYRVIRPAIPTSGISIDNSPLRAIAREDALLNDCQGDILEMVTGNATGESKALDLEMGLDYNLNKSKIDPTLSQNILENTLKGGSYSIDGTMYAVLGTNGTRHIGSKNDSLDHFWVFYRDGLNILPHLVDDKGKPALASNTFATAKKDNNLVVFETKYAYSDAEVQGRRYVYYLPETVTWNEGSPTDIAKLSTTGKRYSDAMETTGYLQDGLSFPETPATVGADSIYRVNADLIVYINGGGTPTYNSTVAGTIVAVVNTADGTVELYLSDGTDYSTAVTSTLGQGCKIYSLYTDTALDGGTMVAGAGLIAIKTAGTTGNAVAVSDKTGVTGSGTATYVIPIELWSYANRDFVRYTGN